jgi:HSP20 family protein
MFYTYDVFEDALRLRNMVDNFFREIPAGNKKVDFPYINLYEKDDTITIRATMPGVKAEDLNVELKDRSLVIEGERKSDYEDKPYLRKEREFGSFKKSVRLPYDVDRDRIRASLSNGIFTITLEKSENAKSKKIDIK